MNYRRNRQFVTVGLAVAAVGGLIACALQPASGIGYARAPALAAPPDPADNPITPEKVALGKQLFFDKRLSGDGSMACQSCHFHHLGWTDGLPLSRKVGGGMNTRHTPTVYNTGYATSWYWDGRAKTLEAQITAAWKGQIGADPVRASALIATIPGYQEQFQNIFGAPPNPDDVAKALAAFLRALNSGEAPWDRHIAGDASAVSPEAIAGYQLFTGKAGCAACHQPPLFTDNRFHNIGLEANKAQPDPGRFAVTKDPADRSAFKTPTLRSVALSGPYFHDGSVASLEQAVRYMAAGGGAGAAKSDLLTDRKLSDQEIAQIVAFLGSLTSAEVFPAPQLP